MIFKVKGKDQWFMATKAILPEGAQVLPAQGGYRVFRWIAKTRTKEEIVMDQEGIRLQARDLADLDLIAELEAKGTLTEEERLRLEQARGEEYSLPVSRTEVFTRDGLVPFQQAALRDIVIDPEGTVRRRRPTALVDFERARRAFVLRQAVQEEKVLVLGRSPQAAEALDRLDDISRNVREIGQLLPEALKKIQKYTGMTGRNVARREQCQPPVPTTPQI